MSKLIVISADETVGCQMYSHGFAVCEGISRHAIERHAEEFD